jgi:hypothetical protein
MYESVTRDLSYGTAQMAVPAAHQARNKRGGSCACSSDARPAHRARGRGTRVLNMV